MKNSWLLFMAFFVSAQLAAQDEKKIESLIKDAESAKKEFLKSDESMKRFFDKSAGYVIFPNVGKGGLGIGGAAGSGIVYAGNQMIGTAKMTQVTIGFQAGGQAYREVVFFETEKELDRFKSNKIEFASQMSAVAAASGISANAQYIEGVAVFTMAKKGLMYEAAVGGQHFAFKAN